jgi:YHS domain-containing protein
MGDVLLAIVLSIVLARAFARLMAGVREGLSGPRQPTAPAKGVQMERDPVCGTFVVPSSALSVMSGAQRVYFCSPACRDAYRSQQGRTA